MSETDLIIHEERDNVAVVVIDKTTKNQECNGWIMENDKTVKITANPQTAANMKEHIDVDVSKILQRKMNLDQAGDILIDSTIKTANGRWTCAEALGHKEFVITKLYRSA